MTVNGLPLVSRSGVRHEAATTFDWGYAGRGAPSQLALAILAHHLGDEQTARRYHENFVRSVIRRLPSEAWTLTGAQIDDVLPQA